MCERVVRHWQAEKAKRRKASCVPRRLLQFPPRVPAKALLDLLHNEPHLLTTSHTPCAPGNLYPIQSRLTNNHSRCPDP